jgi:hypothetical protein
VDFPLNLSRSKVIAKETSSFQPCLLGKRFVRRACKGPRQFRIIFSGPFVAQIQALVLDALRQFRSLVRPEPLKLSFQNRPALSEQFGAAFFTSDRQMKSNCSSVTRWPSSDQLVRFKAVDNPHGPGMGPAENMGKMIDRKSWFMADQGQRRGREAAMSHLALGGIDDLVGETEC